jgi:hypothetical protein
LKWAPSALPSATTLYPNFSHGTAGVGYFLTRLYAATREPAFLEAARAGARYLDAVATRAGGGELVFHHEPGGGDLFYLGWCHGPAGTARFYHALGQVTGEHVWEEKIRAGARALLLSGVPEQRTPGFWNNVSQCCGDAAVAAQSATAQRPCQFLRRPLKSPPCVRSSSASSTGMRARDTVMIRSVFHPEARLYGLNRSGAIEMNTSSSFLQGHRAGAGRPAAR